MFSHEQIWRGIDRLAERAGLSPSGLARRAGLDATTFNPSKRFGGADGAKPRWPSTESLAKALAAAGVEFSEFARLATGESGAARLPSIALGEAGQRDVFDAAGLPASGEAWETIDLPGLDDENAYVIEIEDDAMAPVYRIGDKVMVSPALRPRPGDRVVVKTQAGEVLARQLGAVTASTFELKTINRAHPDRVLTLTDTAWIARIVWASQ